MFNLSDKELDRLSREAASQHDPGDQLMGPGAWERLEARLDKELGGASTPSPSPLRGIRRLPFQYAPVLLLIVGVTYYAVKQFGKPKKAEGSGGPPLTVVHSDQAPASQTNTETLTKSPANSKNSTPPTEKSTTAQYPDSSSSSDGALAAASASDHPTDPAAVASGSNHPTNPVSNHTAGTGSTLNPSGTHINSSGTALRPSGTTLTPSGTSLTHSGTGSRTNTSAFHPGARNRTSGTNLTTSGTNLTASGTSSRPSGAGSRPGTRRGRHDRPGLRQNTTTGADHNKDDTDPNPDPSTSPNPNPNLAASPQSPERGAVHIQRPQSLATHRARINDSSLRAYTPPPAPPAPGRSLHINRSLQFGLNLAPDFSSVNSLAGDKPGSTIGITVDYQIVNRLYLGSGVLFSKKNYTARAEDCHVPYDYFRQNNLHKVDFVKGSMNMLEIPLNLRYDFSVTGNTLFFASAGVSSYLLLNQRSDYYFDSFGREAFRRFNYPEKNTYLLSAVNLSLGVETGISNSLSLLVAPYVKVPARSIGFGEIKMNSVGINFALKFAPVISRKRK